MEKLLEQVPEISAENTPNFHEISENRKELRKAAGELDSQGAIFEKHYKKPLADIQAEAAKFKAADFGGLSGAKKALKKQKAEYEEKLWKIGRKLITNLF